MAGFNTKIRSLQALLHLGSLWALFVAIRTPESRIWLCGTVLMFWFTGVLGINIALHRLLAHNSFTTQRWKYVLLSFISVTTVVGSPIAWCGLHRWHHRHPDTEKDPHSPHIVGNFAAWVGLWKKVLTPSSIIRDLLNDPLQRFIHRHYFQIVTAYAVLLFLLHPNALFFLFCLPATLCLHSTSAISVICHRWGYRSYETKDYSTNNGFVAALTLGEGWHNNHHHAPKDWNFQKKWWEFDAAAWVIRFFLLKKPTPPQKP